MAARTPTVRASQLHSYGEGSTPPALLVGSDAWFDWLAHHRSFRFDHARGGYTARKERRGGGFYWYASRRQEGRLRTVYLGTSADLSLRRLATIAHEFACQSTTTARRTLDRSDPPSVIGEPVLAAKLTSPVHRAHLVARPQLLTQLTAATSHKLTLLTAPAGYGKTTLLSTWVHQRVMPCTWLSLDANDNDPQRFCTYLVHALDRVCPGLRMRVLPVDAAPPPPLEAVLTALLNEMTTLHQDVALVLDDYHVVHAPQIHAALDFLLAYLPPHLHLLVASRTEPPLTLSRLRARGEIAQLHAADLEFTDDEAGVFLRDTMALNLTAEQIAVLSTRTEGWIAGLQLAALSLQHCTDVAQFLVTFAGTDRLVLDYFMDEVLTKQPADIQQFLLDTAILERLTGSSCDALTGRTDGSDLLAALERAHLFLVPLDTQRQWYRYHHLFADLLIHRLTHHQPHRAEVLHQRAAVWHATHGFPVEAVEHALAAADVAYAATLIEQLAETTMRVGWAATMDAWLQALPPAVFRTRPPLGLARGRALLEQSHFAEVEPVLQEVEQALRAHPTLSTMDQQRFSGQVAALRATAQINLGNTHGALHNSRQALDLLAPEDAWSGVEVGQVMLNLAEVYWQHGEPDAAADAYTDAVRLNQRVGNRSTTITALAGFGGLQVGRGQLHAAEQTFVHALDLAAQGTTAPPLSTGKAHLYYSIVLTEWNTLDAALHHLTTGIALCRCWRHTNHVVEGLTLLAHTYLARADMHAALHAITEAKDVLEATRRGAWQPVYHPHLEECVVEAEVALWVVRGDTHALRWWLQEQTLDLQRDHGSPPVRHALLLAHVLLVLHQPRDAVQVLARDMAQAEAEGRTDYLIKLLVAQAAALEAQHLQDAAITTLERALQLAAPGKYIRSFVSQGQSMERLLYSSMAHTSVPAYVTLLLDAFCAPRAAASPMGHALIEPLTERERDVLRLLAAGLSSAAIANHLIIAASTVRTHIKHIYTKLDAHTRAEALMQARWHGLL